MKRILISLFLCSLLCISCASAAGILNGNFTGHTGAYIAHNWTKLGSPLLYEYYDGVYHSSPGCWFLMTADSSGTGYAGLSQNVDLTNAQSLTFWAYGEQLTYVHLCVKIDGIKIYTAPVGGDTSWTNYTTTNITGYSGIHNLSLGYEDLSSSSVANGFVDDVSISYVTAHTVPISISSYSPSSSPTSYYGSSQAFSVTLNQTANNTWYVDNVLRKTENNAKTTTYSNSTAVVGSHTVRCNSTNANGSTSLSWTWTVSDIPGLTVALLDESTGDRITPASVRLYNTTFTRDGEINDSTQSAFINYLNMSDGEYILSGSADGYYSAHGSINLTLATDTEAYMYLVSSDENASSTGLYQRFRLIDNTNTYTLSDCQIRIDKAYDSGTATVYESYFDYQGYTASWLTSTDMYIMYIICPDRTISYGYLAPDPDGLTEIVITDTLPDLWNGWLNYEISADNSTETISISYESQKTLTSAQMWVYYAENKTQAYYTNSSSTNGSLYYTGDNSIAYLVRFLATATDGETREVTQLISWTSDGIQPERLPLLPADAPDWLKNFISAGLIILTVLIFGAIRYDIACIIGTLVAAFLWYTGNLKIEGAVIAACAIIAVAAYMHRSRRE
ncbi:MAG: hypothetical protein ACC612_11450 [Methanomethylovorans sp.]|uniref:hypothetical protein n=1 Tax=Methanomethylovorans sp. TaxID=2758717 RepID=UPI00353152B5